MSRGIRSVVFAGIEDGSLSVVLIKPGRIRKSDTIIESELTGRLPGVLNVPIHNVAIDQVGFACIHLCIGAKISKKLVREMISRIQRVRPVDSEIELTVDQSSPALDIMRDVPIKPRFDRVFIVDKSGGVREIELKVVTGFPESRTEAYCRRVCDSAVGHVWNQVKYVVCGSGKQIAEVYTQTAPRAFPGKFAKVVLGLLLSAVTRTNSKL